MTLDEHLNILHKTGSSKNKNQDAIGCEYSQLEVDGSQLIIYLAAGVHRELRDQFIAARNGRFPWSAKGFIITVREIEHQDVVSSGLVIEELSDNNPWEWTKQASTTLEEATEMYKVEVQAESDT